MYTLSIILNLHREGELAERTIKNLRNVLDFAQKKSNNWASIEVIAVLDNPDDITQQVVNKHNDLFSKIELVNYHDLADSRNHGVSCSSNNFVLFADGDDYVSHNALVALFDKFNNHYSVSVGISDSEQLSALEYNKHIAVFPELLVEFPKLFHMTYVNSNHNIIQNNKFMHCYNSKLCVCKYILFMNKVMANKSPYGYEDWDLNNRLLSLGVLYTVAAYVLYYRKNNINSLLSTQLDKKHIVRYSGIYDVEYYEVVVKDSSINDSHIVKSRTSKNILYRLIRKSSKIKALYHKYQMKRVKYFTPDIFSADKKFLLSYNETNLSLSSQISDSYSYCANNILPQTKICNKLSKFMRGCEIVYFFPWVTLGGADKVSIEYTRSICDDDGCVITNIASGTRIDQIKLPHLDLVSDCSDWSILSENDQLHILVKALISSKVKIIHVVNGEPALKLIKYYANVLKEHNIKIMTSLFCPDYDWINNKYHGYPVMYSEVFANSDIILSDNNYWYDYFKKLNNGSEFNYCKLSSPATAYPISYKSKEQHTKKILWASRICNQKLFDVFSKVVELLPEYHFVVYGNIPTDDMNLYTYNQLLPRNNVEFRGEYSQITELNLNEFDLYLYTSLFDGIPTIILDMIMSGIPIVCSNVGGISEVVGADYDLLVNDVRNPEDYIAKIELFYRDHRNYVDQMHAIRSVVIKDYNHANFSSAYNNLLRGLLNDSR